MTEREARAAAGACRDAYVRRHGSERFGVLLRRKLLGRVQRRCMCAALRRVCARLMGVRILSAPGMRPVWIGPEVYLDDSFPECLTLGPGAVLGVRCMLICHDDAKRTVAPVVIGARSYVGAAAIVLPGVTVGEDAVIGAGAVVTRDIPPGQTWAGVPARPLTREAQHAGEREHMETACPAGDRIGS